jgi:hypothetical protein
MAVEPLVIGPFCAIWIGRAGETGPLTRVNIERTGGGTILVDTPDTYMACKNNSAQSGNVRVEVDLQFATPDARVIKLAMGNFFDASWQDQPSEFEVYSVLLLHADVNVQESIYLPRVRTKKTVQLRRGKIDLDAPPIKLIGENRNRYIQPQLWYKRSKNELITVMGARSPF